MFFSFAGVWGSVCPWAVLDYVPGGSVGELYVVHDVHLFFCKQLWSRLAGRNVSFYSVTQHKEAFHGIGVQDVTEFESH
jgi:hypothetical protein